MDEQVHLPVGFVYLQTKDIEFGKSSAPFIGMLTALPGFLFSGPGIDLKDQLISNNDFWKVPVDVLIPASVTDVINDSNKKSIKAKIIVGAGNIPMSEGIENELFNRGVIIVPDFVANAGGVISSYSEHRGTQSWFLAKVLN